MSLPSPIDGLPEELLLSIFHLIDSVPPSVTSSRQEPSLGLTCSDTHGYKDLASVCQKWRRIALPLLFKFSRLRLENVTATATTARLHHSLDNFLQFTRENNLNVESLAILINDIVWSPAASQDYAEGEIATFWHKLLLETNATRIVIVAPPADLASMTNCSIDLSTEWAFEEMDLHLLELRYDVPSEVDNVACSSMLSESGPSETIAAPSILTMRPWSHLALNVSVRQGFHVQAVLLMTCFAGRIVHQSLRHI